MFNDCFYGKFKFGYLTILFRKKVEKISRVSKLIPSIQLSTVAMTNQKSNRIISSKMDFFFVIIELSCVYTLF